MTLVQFDVPTTEDAQERKTGGPITASQTGVPISLTASENTVSSYSSSAAGAGGGGMMDLSQQSVSSEAKRLRSSVSVSSSKALRSNLTREHKDRDPKHYYELLRVLGEGSMGAVVKVRKRPTLIGRASKLHNQAKTSQTTTSNDKPTTCFQFPLFSGLFQHCIKPQSSENTAKDLFSNVTSTREATTKSTSSETPTSSNENASSTKSAAVATNEGSSSSKEEKGSSADMIYAMKSIHLEMVTKEEYIKEIRNEVAILRTLDHPNIVRVLETFDHDQQIYVVMELCSGGDLYVRDPYTEDQAARICGSVLSAVAYMHRHGVIHRDLKFENILFVNKTAQAQIKLIDFGLSKEFAEQNEAIEGFAGTIYTMAPEVLMREKYTKQADLWSVGVIAFMLMASQMPFHGTSRVQVMKKVVKGQYRFGGKRWKDISAQAKTFVDSLLVKNPSQRSTAAEALQSDWINRHCLFAATTRDPHAGELAAVKRSIERYVNYPKLRKVALMIIAHQSTTNEIGILRKVFQLYDKTKQGTLNYEEFKEALRNAGYSTETSYREIFDAVDVDGTGVIRWTEFLAATMDAVGWISEERLLQAFDRADHDETGYISRENLRHLLGDEVPEEEIDAIMDEAESVPGKGIPYADFRAQWRFDKEQFERELHEITGDAPHDNGDDMIKEATIIRDESTGGLSNLTMSSEDSGDAMATANFNEGKALSMRKLDVSVDNTQDGMTEEQKQWANAGFF